MEIMTTTAVYHNKEMDDYKAELLKVVQLAIFSLVFVLGVLGNGVVIWVTGFKMKKTANTAWYLNLALADFLITAFLPLTITETALDNRWPFGEFMCKLDGTVFFMNMYAGIYTLVAISVDRCVCVVCPVWAQNHRCVRKASWVSLGVWVLGLGLSSPYFIFSATGHDKNITCCYNNFPPPGNYSIHEENQLKFRSGAMLLTRFLMGFLVPFTIIISCYSVIICRLRINRSLAGQTGRPLKIIATVIIALFLCWAPYHIRYLIAFVKSEYTEKLHHVEPITRGLALFNSCLNPLLYVFMGQDFKDVFGRSILKVLEKAFTEELPQTKTSTNPGSSRQETAVSEILV